MKKFFMILSMCILTASAFAEDIIITKDGKEVKAKIEEIGTETIKYRPSDNQQGPLYSIPVNDIDTILYGKRFLEERDGDYYYGGSVISKQEMKNILETQCPIAYKEWQSGKRMINGATTAAGFCLGAIICLATAKTETGIIVGTVIGIGALAAGVPLICVGVQRQNRSLETFNKNCASPAITYNLTAGQNGIGLAINF